MNKYLAGAVLGAALLISPFVASASSLTSAQIQAILGLLQSFNADATTIGNVQASLTGGTSSSAGQAWCHTFTRDLTVGSGGDDVAALNTALTASSIDTTGNTSSFDENSAGDVVSFQAHYGIRQTGYVGPMTRAKLNALYGCHGNPQPTPMPTPITPVMTPPVTTYPPTPISVNDTSFQVLSLKMDNNGPAFAGKSYYVAWKSGSANANQVIYCGVLSANAHIGDGAYQIGSTYLSNGGFTFTMPSSLASGSYLISCNSQTSSLYSNSPTFMVQAANTVPQTIGTLIPSDTFVSFNVVKGASNPQPYNLHLTNGSSAQVSFTLNVPNQPNWYNVAYNTQTMTLNPGEVMGVGVSVDASKVSNPGTYTANLTVSGNFSNSPISIPVTLTVTAATPTTSNAPTISYVSPASASAGGTVIVYGTNFDWNSFVVIDGASGNNINLSPNVGYPVNVATAPGTMALAFTLPPNLAAGSHTINYLGRSVQSDGTHPQSNSVTLTVSVAAPTIDSFSINDSEQFSISANNFSTITFKADCGSFVHIFNASGATSSAYPTGSQSMCNAEQLRSNAAANSNQISTTNQPMVLWAMSGGISYIGNGPTTNNDGPVTITAKACNTAGLCVQKSASFTVHARACLAAGTMISMSDGSYKNIEQIKVGDLVKSFDGVKRTVGVVTKVIQREDPIVTINGVLKAAPDEVVYLANGKTEVADRIKIGDQLLGDGGRAIAVTTLTRSLDLVKTYDFVTKNGNGFFADGYQVQSLSSLSE